jgi:hypothetical protein
MSRLTVTVDVYFTADNAEEARQEIGKIKDDIDVSLAGAQPTEEFEVIEVQAERPREMSP